MRRVLRLPDAVAMSTVFPAQPSDAALLERVAHGDGRAFELIHERYRNPAHVLAHRLCGRHCIAEEVVQEAFLAIWRGAVGYRESRGGARAWILTIVRNRAIDARRRDGRSQRDVTMLGHLLEEHLADSALTDVEAEQRERGHAVRGALRRLPAAQRETLVLSYFRGLTHHETAAALARPIGTVKSRIRLGHAKLRRDLGGVVGAPP